VQNQAAGPTPATALAASPKLMATFAERFGIDANKMMGILRATAFNTGKTNGQPNPPATDEEIAALVVVANEYNLNPFTKEIGAFRNRGGGITPVVQIDGWVRLVERQPAYQGEEMKNGYDDTIGPDGKTPLGFYYECFMYRSDRRFPISRRQYYNENVRNTEPWNGMPTRMLQHRAYIQSARATFGFGGIYDQDEGERIANTIDITPRNGGVNTKPQTRAPRELPRPAARTLEHQEADTLQPQSISQHETVGSEATGQTDEFRSLASEPPEDEEMEPGSRG